jgi:hypothetical protein
MFCYHVDMTGLAGGIYGKANSSYQETTFQAPRLRTHKPFVSNMCLLGPVGND